MLLDEKTLVEGIKNGDEESFIEVVDMFKRKILSLCYSYTKDYQEAEDLSQEVFIKLYNSIDNFRGECSLATYIYKITVSKCLDYVRKNRFKNLFTGLIKDEEDRTESFEDKGYIKQCIVALPEKFKTPVILHYYMGLSYKEIGDILNITAKNVEGRIYRAKQRLKKELESEGYFECSRNGMI